MMLKLPDYNFTLIIPADTRKDTPEEVEMKLVKGIIASGQLQFPAGCHGMVNIAIYDSKQQLYPANPPETYHGDDMRIPLVGIHELDKPPYKLKMKGWSPGTSYQHTIQLAISVLPAEVVSPYKVIEDFVAILKKMLRLP